MIPIGRGAGAGTEDDAALGAAWRRWWTAAGTDVYPDEVDWVQILADAALGAAWRRCEAALPEGWRISTLMTGSPLQDDGEWSAFCGHRFGHGAANASGPTPTAALQALAEKLESLRP